MGKGPNLPKVDENTKKRIIRYFNKKVDNTMKAMSKHFDMPEGQIEFVVDEYLERLERKMHRRIQEEENK